MLRSLRQAIALAVAVALLVTTTACYDKKTVQMAPPDRPGENDRLLSVTTVDGEVVNFEGNVTIFGESIVGTSGQKNVSVPVSKVQRYVVEQRKMNTWKTIGLVVGVVVVTVAVVGAVALAAKQSCPFLYSWDGTKYVFDAEPYGGAITRGLERDDDTVLDRLQPDGGVYRLLLTNEVDETQYTNHLSLRVVDHPPSLRIVPGDDGTLYTVGRPLPPLLARTADGRDLTRWLAASDARIFEPVPSVGSSGETRDEIVLTFPKPAGASRAKLVVNAGTSLFGSFMIRETLRLRGRDLDGWLAEVDRNPGAARDVHEWVREEELWALKLDVEEAGGWTKRGVLLGAGPLIVKDRVVPLDVTGAAGDTLRIRIRPPKGYWALNSFAVDYTPDEPVLVENVALAEARDAAGRDRRAALLRADDLYDELPVGTTDQVALTFPAPEPKPGLARTVVLHARGWYALNLRASGEPDREALVRLETEPGFGVRFAAARHARWLAGLSAPVSPEK